MRSRPLLRKEDESKRSMLNQKSSPTLYPEVNRLLDTLIPEIQASLGQQFIGMYLYGSLAYGGFDEDSDVDFVVVTRTELSDELVEALQDMHDRIAAVWYTFQLEGTYIPEEALRQFDPVKALYLHLDRGMGERLHRMHIEEPLLSRAWWSGWVMLRSVLLKKGITVAGPAPASLMEPILPGELKEATLANLVGWAAPLLNEPQRISHTGYQSYCVLTMCRSLYSLEYDSIVSKQAAARWAMARFGEPWRSLIERTWDGRHHPDQPAASEEIQATLDFIRFTLQSCHVPLTGL